jgi:REP element-mobilizing transposase RayT
MTLPSPADGGRRRIRLPEFDYSQPGAYFVTICTHDRRCILSEIKGGEVRLLRIGSIVLEHWQSIPSRHDGITLDEFVIMPNHIHGILVLETQSHPLPGVIGSFKSLSTKAVNAVSRQPNDRLWQRSYHEHVIRSEEAQNRIREYIENNPMKWHLDRENPATWKPARRLGRAEPGPYK